MAGGTRDEDTVIHSDSMAAIKILAQAKTRTYPDITTKIINSASALGQRGSLESNILHADTRCLQTHDKIPVQTNNTKSRHSQIK